MLTPYQYASNTPIASIDLEGAEGLWYVYAKSGMYGEKTSTIINATEDGVKLTVLEAYEFLTKDAYKISTWKQLGYLLEEVILSSSPYSGIYNPNTPQLDALVNNFEINVINGDLYSRTKVLSSFSTGLIISALSDKGLGKLSELSHLSKFKNGASKLMSTGQLDDIARRFPDSEFYGDPRGTFVAPASEIDELLNSGASRVEIAERLGITDDLFLEGDLIRIDVSPKAFENLRIPTGSESGVNNMFKSGGRTSGGVREGILNNIRKKSSNINTKIVNEE
ncbi:hypothetical protein GCM10007049_30960 [Echinicola pacifica]|uniref:RHS repeat-associated core domain-containing protein n=2 Tax=Echinicola pacifica TaxID=346377 RepID=A0A918UV63_9BACT|nr:hypothetical protein GCM10007049_30960 [Echinicola pacifica]